MCAEALPTWSGHLLTRPESSCFIFSVQNEVLAQSRKDNVNKQKYTVQVC